MTFSPASISPTTDYSQVAVGRIPTVATRPQSGVALEEKPEHSLVVWYNPTFDGYELYMLDEGGYRYYRVS